MNTLHEIINENRKADHNDTAWAVIAAIELPEEFHELLFQLIRAECARTDRNATRLLEEIGIDGIDIPEPRDMTPTEERDAYMKKTFFNGIERVYWATATVDDHQGRIDYLTRQRRGLDKTIKRHQGAIKQIMAHGVTCLAEIKEPVTA